MTAPTPCSIRCSTSHCSRKVGALHQAPPRQGWAPPEAFPTLRRLLEAGLSGKNRCAAGKRAYVQALRLLETFPMSVVYGAVTDARPLGAIGYDAVKHLALCRVDRRPPKPRLDARPYLPEATVETTSAARHRACWRATTPERRHDRRRGARDPPAPPPSRS